jgi:hypothetical protein
MNQLFDGIISDPTLKIIGWGCESGAMVVHYQWRKR